MPFGLPFFRSVDARTSVFGPAQSTFGELEISSAPIVLSRPSNADDNIVSFPQRMKLAGEPHVACSTATKSSNPGLPDPTITPNHSMDVQSSATWIQMLWSRQQEWDARMRMIARARSFLYLSTFYIEWGERAKECLNALVNAQQRGVSTVLLIDQFGQRLGGTQMNRQQRRSLQDRLQQLRDSGGKVVPFQADHWIDRLLCGGQHIKIQVSEQGEAIFGSSNLSDQSFTGWNEFSVAVQGPISGVLLNNLQGLVGDQAGFDRCQAGFPSSDAGPISLRYIAFSPTQEEKPSRLWRGSANPISSLLCREIDRATSQIEISSFYFKPIASVRDALKRASKRGVRVRVFHSDRQTLSSSVPWLAAATDYRSLLKHGIELYETTQGEHSKIVLIDDRWAAFGSYHLEDAADDRLAEAMMVTEESELIGYFRRLFTQLRDSPNSHRVPADAPDRWCLKTRWSARMILPIKR